MNIMERFEKYIQGDEYKVVFGSSKRWNGVIRHYARFYGPDSPNVVAGHGVGDTLEEAIDQLVKRLEEN